MGGGDGTSLVDSRREPESLMTASHASQVHDPKDYNHVERAEKKLQDMQEAI